MYIRVTVGEVTVLHCGFMCPGRCAVICGVVVCCWACLSVGVIGQVPRVEPMDEAAVVDLRALCVPVCEVGVPWPRVSRGSIL